VSGSTPFSALLTLIIANTSLAFTTTENRKTSRWPGNFRRYWHHHVDFYQQPVFQNMGAALLNARASSLIGSLVSGTIGFSWLHLTAHHNNRHTGNI